MAVRIDLNALRAFQQELMQLSNTLTNISTEMDDNIVTIQNSWDDPQYVRFKQGFNLQIEKCRQIALWYQDWCKKTLANAGESVENILRSDLGEGGTGVASTGAGATAAATAAPTSLKSGFYTPTTSKSPETKTEGTKRDRGVYGNVEYKVKKWLFGEPQSEADKLCEKANGEGSHGHISTIHVTNSKTGGKVEAGMDVGGEANLSLDGTPGVKGKVNEHVKYVSGVNSRGESYVIECDPK